MGTTLTMAPSAYAQTTTNPITTLIERIAQKFGLKQADVQTVFNQFHEERQKEMQTRMEERLSQFVKDGKLTEAQKQLVLAKHKELQNARQKNVSSRQLLTPDERRAQKGAQHQEMLDWAKQNNIDLQYLAGLMGLGHGQKGMWR